MKNFLEIKNCSAVKIADIPVLPFAGFRQTLIDSTGTEALRVAAFFPLEKEGKKMLAALLVDPVHGCLRLAASETGEKFPSLTPEAPVFHWFERELYERYGMTPEGHPWLKPIRKADGEYFTMTGDAVNEVAVGPVHAGVIEPGHFRFQCMGEKVYSLEISLGYQSRGVEKLLEGGFSSRTLPLFESAAGDTAAAAATGAAALFEALSGTQVTPRAQQLRAIMIELERVANHTGDLGALAGDVAYLPTASFCGRIRGEYLNMTAEICGNRFGRNFLQPGGVRYDVADERCEKLLKWLDRVDPELKHALDLMFNSPTVLDRFENTGTVSTACARELGLAGVAGRASGLDIDSRRDLGDDYLAPACGKYSGDVLSRAKVRYEELKRSHAYLQMALLQIRAGVETAPALPEVLPPDVLALSVTEAWRGELCHAALTGNDGRITLYKIVDPSMHNWEGLAMALRSEEIAHFPICNKSFNLSYCGHDL
jgi:Ni,Fe-hydrogenase III large subunit